MQHVVYSMRGSDVPPAGGGTTEGWFYYYKWDADGEAYLPVPAQESAGAPAAGDILWLVLDSTVLGYVPVLNILIDELNARLEIYYDTRHLCEIKVTLPVAAETSYCVLQSQALDEFVLSHQVPSRLAASGNKESGDATSPCSFPENVSKTLVQGLAVNRQQRNI